jgi:LDH2 family malate/lactate/ureidoglycolate dehydrogenase
VGKTDVARSLMARIDGPAALVETDALAPIYPFTADGRFIELVRRNLDAVVPNLLAWGARTLVVAGVARHGAIYDLVVSMAERVGAALEVYVLRASAATIGQRIRSDAKVQDAAQRMSWLFLDDELARLPGATSVNTEGKPISAVVDQLADLLGRAGTGQVQPADGGYEVERSIEEVSDAVVAALLAAGASSVTAETVAAHLLDAETRGVVSHGLIRVPEYLDQIARGLQDPRAIPSVTRQGNVTIIDGNRCLGAVAAPAIVESLVSGLEEGVAVTAIRNCGHLGRLGAIGVQVALRGAMVLGFVNFQGGGQRVAPVGGRLGRMATNPILFAAPMASGPPIVVDLSTSATSEGSVRLAGQRGELLEPGLLLDTFGEWVLDPSRLYATLPTATLAPLGGVSPHKGYALGVMVEVLAGALAGAGVVDAGVVAEGNGGLFISLPADLFRPAGSTLEDLVRLEAHLQSTQGSVRLPGRPDHAWEAPGTVRMSVELWKAIAAAA